MIVKKIPQKNKSERLYLHSMFEEVLKEKDIEGTFNYVEIPGNYLTPSEGYTSHNFDELSLIIEGEIEANIDGKEYKLVTGDYTLIKKGTPHKTFNRKEKVCKIVSLLI